MSLTAEHRLPGDPEKHTLVEQIIRVDHAGEYGAKRIYEGQLAVLKGNTIIQHMKEQEQEHLDYFEKAIVERRVRPTLLTPVWHVAGFALGAATALLGEKAAMACTVAVEEVIDGHYQSQLAKLGEDEAELKERITKFREEELEHRDTGLQHHAEQAPAYPVLTHVIKAGSRMAIWLSTRI